MRRIHEIHEIHGSHLLSTFFSFYLFPPFFPFGKKNVDHGFRGFHVLSNLCKLSTHHCGGKNDH